MHVILLALGLLTSVAGIVLIGFGIPINAFSLGNTLIVAGTIAIVGSLILIGLASAIRQLRRIAQALEARPIPRTLGTEPPDDLAARVPSPLSVPLPSFEPRREPELDRPAPLDVRAIEEAEPRAPSIDVAPVAPTERIEPVEPTPIERAAPVEPIEPIPSVEPPAEPAHIEEPAPTPPPPKPAPAKTFDQIWADESPVEPPSGVSGGERLQAPVELAHTDDRLSGTEPAPAPPRPEEPVTIFKSGVIEGMAYTLYTDGSIEAELPQGTVKFASIEDLRAYLAARE